MSGHRPPRANVTLGEMAAAAALVDDLWGFSRGAQVAAVAATLADAREGMTIPGERMRGSVHLDVSSRSWAAELRPRLYRDVRRRWAGDLEAAGLRPLGWPPVTVTYWRYAIDYSGALWADDDRPRGMTETSDPEGADMVRLTIDGLAVKA